MGYARGMPDPDPPFDAVAAARELDELLGEPGVGAAGTGNEDYIAGLESELEALNAVLATKELELQRERTRADQAHAEIEQASKRITGASAKELERRTRQILESFLSVLDDMDRAIAAARAHVESQDVVEGVELVRRSLLSRLGQFGVSHAPAKGHKFDPQRHDAIAIVPVTDPAQDGIVIDVMREGYVMGDTTLRPAGVAVGKRG